jgi:hypothetical protein
VARSGAAGDRGRTLSAVPIYIPPELNPDNLPREEWIAKATLAGERQRAEARQRERDLFRYARWQALGTIGALVVAIVALVVALAK